MNRKEIENKLYDLDYENDNVAFSDLFYLIAEYKKKIIFTTLVTFLLSLIIAFTIPTLYRAESIMVTNSLRNDNLDILTNTDVIKNQNLIKSFQIIATDKELVQSVMDEIGINGDVQEEIKNIDISLEENTQFLKISYTSSNPVEAKEFLNSLTEEISKRVNKIIPSQTLQNIYEIKTPSEPLPKRRGLIIGIGIVLGLILGILISLLDMIFRNKITTIKDFEKNSKMKVLTTIQNLSNAPSEEGEIYEQDTQISKAMALFKMRSKLEKGEKGKHILVTSTLPKEGKTTFSKYLAKYLGELGYKVLVTEMHNQNNEQVKSLENIDAEEKTNIENFFNNLKLEEEIRNILNQVVRKVQVNRFKNVDYIYEDKINHLNKIIGNNMESVITQMKDNYDFVIVDIAALSTALEPFFLREKIVDYSIYIAGYNMVTPKELRFYSQLVSESSVENLGLVINGVTETAYKYKDFNNGHLRDREE